MFCPTNKEKKPLLIHRGCGGGRGVINSLPLLPLKLRFVADLMPFCGFSACYSALMRHYSCLCRSIAEKKNYREWSKSLGGGGADGYGASGGRVLPLLLVVDLVILGIRKKNASRGQKFGLCCYR